MGSSHDTDITPTLYFKSTAFPFVTTVELNVTKGSHTVVKVVIEGSECQEKFALSAAILNMLLGYVNGVSEKDDIHVQRCNKVLFNRAVKRDRMIRELYVFSP